MFRWINLYPIAQIEGYVYFAACVDGHSNNLLGWVTRTGLDEPYVYNTYFVDAGGGISSLGPRGTWRHALWAVQGAIKSPPPPSSPSSPSPPRQGVVIQRTPVGNNLDARLLYAQIRGLGGR